MIIVLSISRFIMELVFKASKRIMVMRCWLVVLFTGLLAFSFVRLNFSFFKKKKILYPFLLVHFLNS